MPAVGKQETMAAGGTLSFSVASMVEDVLQQHGTRLGDLNLESRKAEEAGNHFSILVSFFLLLLFVGKKKSPANT